MTLLVERLFRAAVRLFPAGFRDIYGREMAQIFSTRLRERSSSDVLRFAAREVGDVVLVALRVRLSAAPRWQPALLAGAAITVVAGWLATQQGWQLVPAGAMRGDSLDFNARDPAGEFTITIRRGQPVAATIDRVPWPRHRLVQAGDSIRLLAPGGGVVLAVAFDPERARIEWDARPPACRGNAARCIQGP